MPQVSRINSIGTRSFLNPGAKDGKSRAGPDDGTAPGAQRMAPPSRRASHAPQEDTFDLMSTASGRLLTPDYIAAGLIPSATEERGTTDGEDEGDEEGNQTAVANTDTDTDISIEKPKKSKTRSRRQCKLRLSILIAIVVVMVGVAVTVVLLRSQERSQPTEVPSPTPEPTEPSENIFSEKRECSLGNITSICKENGILKQEDIPFCVDVFYDEVKEHTGLIRSDKEPRTSCDTRSMALKKMSAIMWENPWSRPSTRLLGCQLRLYENYFEYDELEWWTPAGANESGACESSWVTCQNERVLAFLSTRNHTCLLSDVLI